MNQLKAGNLVNTWVIFIIIGSMKLMKSVRDW